jgi:hypothetical protein
MRRASIVSILAVIVFSCCAFDDSGCGQSTDQKTSDQQEQMQQQAMAQVGMPGITNFTELKLVKRLYELRDTEIVTYAYIPDMQGKLWHLCDSIGYGLPYAVQFSNPMKDEHTNYPMPQAEPNGLFMPASAEGTWVMCGTRGGTHPVYVEPRVIVSPFKLKAEGEYALE